MINEKGERKGSSGPEHGMATSGFSGYGSFLNVAEMRSLNIGCLEKKSLKFPVVVHIKRK